MASKQQIHELIDKYLDAGGSMEFVCINDPESPSDWYVMSLKDYKRNILQA